MDEYNFPLPALGYNELAKIFYKSRENALRDAIALGQQGFDAPGPTLSETLDAVNRGTIGGTLGAPVDIANELLRPLGMATEKPFLGSEWLGERMQDAGMVTDKRDPLLETAAGFVDPLSGLAKVAALGGKGFPLLGAHTVFHGSPHSFDAFDASKIGTGEGAQAYGHGIYFAESPEVAGSYREGLSDWYPHGQPTTPGTVEDRAAAFVADAMASQSSNPFGKAREDATKLGAGDDVVKQIEKWWEQGTPFEKQGALYKADIPDEWLPRMLDWDKPLSEQGEEVRKALEKAVSKRPEISGAELYNVFGGSGKLDQTLNSGFDFGNQASETLRDLGIPGIRYLDGGSRNNASWKILSPDETVSKKWAVSQFGGNNRTLFETEEEARNFYKKKNDELSYNYVIFPGNEDKVKILERNGQPLK